MQLAEIEEDAYEPASIFGHATIASISAGQGNPFAEAFAEEEVIVDRYASADALASQPIVRSIEGKLLADMLAPYVNPKPQHKFTLTSPAAEIDDEPADEIGSGTTYTIEPGPVVGENPVHGDDHDPVMPEEPWVYEEEPPTVEQPAAEAQHSPPISIDDEEPMIIVEDDPRVSRTVRVPSSVAKRQEYRQLFAKLRRS